MRLSFEQARLLNIDEDIIRRAERHGLAEKILDTEVEPPRPKRDRPADGMNKTERAFAEGLQSNPNIRYWWREPLTFRLAGRTRYTPDFGVLPEDFADDWSPARLTLVEIKGFMRDDAAVKIKVAAERFPFFNWLVVYRLKQHGWDVRTVDHRGIGKVPIQVPWLR